MSGVLDYLDGSLFAPVYQNDLPLVLSPSTKAICDELYYAIKSGEEIFVYGDYDADGFCCNLVWNETLSSLYDVPPVHFMYGNRQHSVDIDIVRQVKNTNARVVIICDSGSGLEDQRVLDMLIAMGCVPLVIDHHVYVGDYNAPQQHVKMYNAFEERSLLDYHEVCGGYACLLVANRLCREYFNRPVPFNACVYALCSMYADAIDMSFPAARALYNYVASSTLPGPGLFSALNKWHYMFSRRLFSFIIVPKINACFRTENYDPLNKALLSRDKFALASCASLFEETHTFARELTIMFTPMFTRERYGNIVVAVHDATPDTRRMHVRNFSGIIANKIADEEKCLAVVLIRDKGVLAGSYRDYFDRRLLDTFKVFCDAGGHDQAFGLTVTDYNDFIRHISLLSKQLVDAVQTEDIVLSGTLVKTPEDVSTMALYNEYMNTKPRVLVSHRCTYAKILRSTTYKRFYDVGLPLTIQSKTPLMAGSNISLEPCITSEVELRCIE